MKKILIIAALLAAAMTTASAQFGKFTPSETKKVKDAQTGVELKVLTNTEGNDKFIYQTDPMWTPDGKYLMFRSSDRGVTTGAVEMPMPPAPQGMAQGAPKGAPQGAPQMRFKPTQYFFVEIATGRIIQATDGNVGSVFLSNKTNSLYVNLREGDDFTIYVMDLNKLFADANRNQAGSFKSYLKKIGTFPSNDPEMGRPGGWCVNSDDTYAYIAVSREGTAEERAAMEAAAFKVRDDQPVKVGQSLSGIRKMDLRTGEVTKICDVSFRVGHIQCSRFRPNEIVFCCETGGDANQRMWFADANTNEYKALYKETPLDWVTHETFGTEDYVYFNVLGWQDRLRKQATGIFRINLRTDDVECLGNVELDKDRQTQLVGRGFWHCNSTRDNSWACGDTFGGSVWIINVATGHKYRIASDLRMVPDHAQPFFSPNGRYICFQSGHYSDAKRLNLVMVDLTKLPFYTLGK